MLWHHLGVCGDFEPICRDTPRATFFSEELNALFVNLQNMSTFASQKMTHR